MICPQCTTETHLDGTCPMCIAYERALHTLPKPEYITDFRDLSDREQEVFTRLYGEIA